MPTNRMDRATTIILRTAMSLLLCPIRVELKMVKPTFLPRTRTPYRVGSASRVGSEPLVVHKHAMNAGARIELIWLVVGGVLGVLFMDIRTGHARAMLLMLVLGPASRHPIARVQPASRALYMVLCSIEAHACCLRFHPGRNYSYRRAKSWG